MFYNMFIVHIILLFSFAKHLLTEWQMFMSILKPIIQCTYTWKDIIINLFEWNKTNVSKLSENIFFENLYQKRNRKADIKVYRVKRKVLREKYTIVKGELES